MTPWVTRLIIANAGMFLVLMILPRVGGYLLLVPADLLGPVLGRPFRPWTIITYMFLHAGPLHLFFNMLALYFFGPRLEVRLGSRQFLTLYFVSGIVAALVSLIFTPYARIVGASGAVFGVLLGFARFWPRNVIYIWGVLPIEARWLVLLLTALSLWGGYGGGSGVAHFAHLGGFLGGYLYLKWLDWRSPARRFKKQAAAPTAKAAGSTDLQRWKRIRRDGLHQVNRDELDRILDKISAKGLASLTPEERAFLERFSQQH
jgi:membrane associated rhomboid family serine protease